MTAGQRAYEAYCDAMRDLTANWFGLSQYERDAWAEVEQRLAPDEPMECQNCGAFYGKEL